MHRSYLPVFVWFPPILRLWHVATWAVQGSLTRYNQHVCTTLESSVRACICTFVAIRKSKGMGMMLVQEKIRIYGTAGSPLLRQDLVGALPIIMHFPCSEKIPKMKALLGSHWVSFCHICLTFGIIAPQVGKDCVWAWRTPLGICDVASKIEVKIWNELDPSKRIGM